MPTCPAALSHCCASAAHGRTAKAHRGLSHARPRPCVLDKSFTCGSSNLICGVSPNTQRRGPPLKATEGDEPQDQEAFPQQQQQSPPGDQQADRGEPAGLPKLEKGQGTAIVTGAVSIVFGVLYLVLIQLLDTRGSQLEPPPPEAFGL